MRTKSVTALVLLAMALIISVGSVSFLSPCVHEDGSAAACTSAGRACLWIGILIALLAVLVFLFRSHSVRIVLLFTSLLASAAGILAPGTLFPLCKMSSMRCRALMQPAMIILFVLALLVSAAGIASERRKLGREKA